MPKRKWTAVGITASGKIAAKKSNVRVRSTDADLAIGLMSRTGTECEHEKVDVAVSSTNQADGNSRSSLVACQPSSSSAAEIQARPGPANIPAPSSIESLMAATLTLANGGYGNVSVSHNVSGRSTRRVEYEAGADEGVAVANLSSKTNLKDEDVLVVVKGQVTDDDRKAYTDSWKSILHDYTDVHMAVPEKHGQAPAHQPFLFKNLKFKPRKSRSR